MGLHIKESALFIILIILFTPLAFVLMPVIAALIIMGALIMVLMPKRDHHQQKTM